MLKEIFHNRFENFEFTRICMENPGGALGYFLGGYVPPGSPNWHPVLKKILLKLIPRSRIRPKTDTPF